MVLIGYGPIVYSIYSNSVSVYINIYIYTELLHMGVSEHWRNAAQTIGSPFKTTNVLDETQSRWSPRVMFVGF